MEKFTTKTGYISVQHFRLKKPQSDKGADFYFVRDLNGSTIDYFLQMIVEGAASSTVPLTRHIYRKEYKKATGTMLPPKLNLH